MAIAQKDNGAAVTAPPAGVDRSGAVETARAHSHINLSLDIGAWKALSQEIVDELVWFHQFLLDNNLTWKEAAQGINYSQTTVYRVLKGSYEGDWASVVAAIRNFRKLEEQRGAIQQSEFIENSISRLIFSALNYALLNSSIATIIGESGAGKSISARAWAEQNNHGRAVFVTAPVSGGEKSLIRAICKRCGIKTLHHRSIDEFTDAIYRAFNKNRILVIDESHRLLPSDVRSRNPAALERLRDIHDETGCALALISTRRLPAGLNKGAYIHEQLIGRVDMPALIKPKIKRADIVPIIKQFIKNPSGTLLDDMDRIANSPGRLRIMVKTLKFAGHIARKSKQTLGETHVRKAIAIRAQMSAGGNE